MASWDVLVILLIVVLCLLGSFVRKTEQLAYTTKRLVEVATELGGTRKELSAAKSTYHNIATTANNTLASARAYFERGSAAFTEAGRRSQANKNFVNELASSLNASANASPTGGELLDPNVFDSNTEEGTRAIKHKILVCVQELVTIKSELQNVTQDNKVLINDRDQLLREIFRYSRMLSASNKENAPLHSYITDLRSRQLETEAKAAGLEDEVERLSSRESCLVEEVYGLKWRLDEAEKARNVATVKLSASQDALAVAEANCNTAESENASLANRFADHRKSAASEVSALRAEIVELKCVARHADNKVIIAEREQKTAYANAAKWKKERDDFEARAILAESKVSKAEMCTREVTITLESERQDFFAAKEKFGPQRVEALETKLEATQAERDQLAGEARVVDETLRRFGVTESQFSSLADVFQCAANNTAKLEAEKQCWQQYSAELEQVNTSVTQELVRSTTLVAEAAAKNRIAEAAVADQQAKYIELKAEKEELQSNFQEACAHGSVIEQKLLELQEASVRDERELESAQMCTTPKQIAKLNKKCARLEQDNKDLQSRVYSAANDRAQLSTQIWQLNSHLTDAQKTIAAKTDFAEALKTRLEVFLCRQNASSQPAFNNLPQNNYIRGASVASNYTYVGGLATPKLDDKVDVTMS